MWAGGQYRNLVLLVDTCQAASLGRHLNAPNTFMLASSDTGAMMMMGFWVCRFPV